jgi:hypothetical protein
MNVNGTLLACLPIELQEMIFDMVAKSKMTEVLEEISLQLLPGDHNKRFGTLHENLTKYILTYPPIRGGSFHYNYNYKCFEDLQEWFSPLWDEQLVDRDSRIRIEKIIEESSPYFVYIEDLTYQELLAFKSFII